MNAVSTTADVHNTVSRAIHPPITTPPIRDVPVSPATSFSETNLPAQVSNVHAPGQVETTQSLSVRRFLSTFDRAFPVTAARAWNALPSSVRSAPSSLLQFRRDLKTALHVSVIVLFTVVFSCVTDCNCNL